MSLSTNTSLDRPSLAAAAPSGRMPFAVKIAMASLLVVLVSGGLYLLAVRGDALLADLAAVAALICG